MIDLDIRGFFDNLDHALLLKAVDHLHPTPWVRLCLVRWLKAEIIFPDGHRHSPQKGTPQGGIISPLLAILFLHYTQDKWLEKHYPNNSWEKYADDSIIHCRSRREAGLLLCQPRERMKACGLELHPEKTRIVNYHPLTRRKNNGHYSFDFLGFTFRRRAARKITGGLFTRFLPAISNKAQKAIVRTWNIQRLTSLSAEERLTVRTVPLMQSLYDWIQQQTDMLSRHSDTAKAFAYLLKRWDALNEYCRNGWVEIDNNLCENALRVVALGRRNYMLFGSDGGGDSAAVMYSLIT